MSNLADSNLAKLQQPLKATVKWYSPQKGFGFLVADNVDEDIFLHFSVLDATEFKHLNEQDEVICEVSPGDKGLQINKILEIIPHDIADIKIEDGEEVTTVDGVVRWFNTVKGFGFVAIDDQQKDVFLHISVLRRLRKETLVQGQRVRMKVVNSIRGREARDIELL